MQPDGPVNNCQSCLQDFEYCSQAQAQCRNYNRFSTNGIGMHLGEMWGSRIIWIDCIARYKRVSLSGRIIYRIADLFMVQWPELAEKYSKAVYCGRYYDLLDARLLSSILQSIRQSR